MPNYGYRCQSCQREFEVLQRMADPPQAACPDCGGAGTRLFYATGILFKGSGFYKTDSRSTAGATASAGADTSKPATDGAGDGVKPPAAAKDAPAATPTPKTTAAPPSATPSATE